jgi:hypothetical protein
MSRRQSGSIGQADGTVVRCTVTFVVRILTDHSNVWQRFAAEPNSFSSFRCGAGLLPLVRTDRRRRRAGRIGSERAAKQPRPVKRAPHRDGEQPDTEGQKLVGRNYYFS